MSCPGCEIHRVIYGVTKQSQARPTDDAIPTSSKLVRANDIKVVDEHGNGAVPPVVGVGNGTDDGGVA